MNFQYKFGGFGVGAVIAGVLSYNHNHSIILAIIHFLMNWAYVLYYFVRYGFNV